MLAVSILLVFTSGFIHSIWNLYTKKSIHKQAFLWFCQLVATVVYFPLAVFEFSQLDAVPVSGWIYVWVSMALHGLYILLLAMTYTVGELSQVYPIMRGISPLLVPLVGSFVLNEHLKFVAWIGVFGIVIGILIAGDVRPGKISFQNKKAVILAFGVGIMITCYTVVDKVTLRHVAPILLNEATNFGNLLALTWAAFRSKKMKQEWAINWKTILLGGVLAPGGYILFLFALHNMQVSQLAPMREIGTVFGTLLGIFLLKEKQGTSRVIASVLITIGIILLAQ